MPTPTNPYYQRHFDATGGQLARARTMVTEFKLIQRGFDLIGFQNATIKYQLSGSDLFSELVPASACAYFRTTDSMNLFEVRASVLEASLQGAVRLDIRINGFQALFRPLVIDQGHKTSLTSANPTSIAYIHVPDDSEVIIDILNAGVGAKGLIISFLGARTA